MLYLQTHATSPGREPCRLTPASLKLCRVVNGVLLRKNPDTVSNPTKTPQFSLDIYFMNGFKNLILSPLLQTGVIHRYSGLHLARPESVSDHTCQVGILATIIASECVKRGCKVDLGKVALYALVHDFDEALTGDIPRNIKYFYPELRDLLGQVAAIAIETLTKQLDLPSLKDLWHQSKTEGIEGFIVLLADTLQCVKKLVEEVEILGNLYMLRIALELQEHVEMLEKHIDDFITCDDLGCKQFIFDLLGDAINLIKKIRTDNDTNIKELGIDKLKFTSG